MRHPTFVLSSAIALLVSTSLLRADLTVTWRCTTPDAPWVDEGTIPVLPTDHQRKSIQIYDYKKLQHIQGWGGCFNEKGWEALSALSPADRDGVIKALFDPKDGMRLSVCRSPIGASDYAVSGPAYSLDDTPDDYDMSHFTIERDRKWLIPFIKAAIAQRKDLKIWGVPWTPPAWMKDSNTLTNGHIKTDAQTMNALALYFEKYVQAYRAEGIPVYMVMPQNEPTISSNYTSCSWTGEELHNFLKDYMGPLFARDRVNCQIWLGTFQNSDYSYVAPTFDDPTYKTYVQGAGFQWYGDASCRFLHYEHPDLQLMQTETPCGNHENDWNYANNQFDTIRNYMEAGVNAYMLWNMVLDETGVSDGDWHQSSPVTIDTKAKKVIYNPQFYVYKHFSYYVQPGAYRIFLDGDYSDKLGYVNSNGDVVVVLKNGGDQKNDISMGYGDFELKPSLPPHSVCTLVFHHTP
jgi:glucosylceramidase